MFSKIFHSKSFIYFSVVFFSFFLVSNTFSNSWAIQAQDWEKELKAGIDLYNEGQFSEAILHFNRVLSRTQDTNVLINVHYNLSICHFYAGNNDAAEQSIKNLLILDPSRQAPDAFPNKYRNLYTKMRKELSRESARMTYEEPQRLATQETPYRAQAGEPRVKKKKGLLFIIGGVVLAGAVGTGVILLAGKNGESTGDIQISSNPQGAQVYLDGSNTGQITNCTLTDISPGTHQIKLVKEGYIDQQSSTTVTNGETAQLSFTLSQHSLSIMNIDSGTHWMIKENVEIKWDTSGLSVQQGATQFFPNAPSLSSQTQRSASHFSNMNSHSRPMQGLSNWANRQNPETALKRSMESTKNRGLDQRMNSLQPRVLIDLSKTIGPKSNFPANNSYLPFANNQNKSNVGLQILTNIKIELLKGNSLVETIVNSTENDGSFNWTVSENLTDGSDYSIKTSCADSPEVFVESSQFTITKTKTVRYDSTDTPIDVIGTGDVKSWLTVDQAGIITNVKYYVWITHTWVGDLIVRLTAPDETFDILREEAWTEEGGNADNLELDDNTSKFNGKQMQGDWMLRVDDQYPWADDGRLEFWWIEITYQK
jgi:subtilisin-like proprotein convertase family protein